MLEDVNGKRWVVVSCVSRPLRRSRWEVGGWGPKLFFLMEGGREDSIWWW